MVKLRINLGTQNALTPPLLISVINRATPGPKLRLGRIRIMERDSVFEVSPESAAILMPGLNTAEFQGRKVRAVIEHDATHGMGRSHGHPHEKRKDFHHRGHRGPPR
jgi:hypothetical protein